MSREIRISIAYNLLRAIIIESFHKLFGILTIDKDDGGG